MLRGYYEAPPVAAPPRSTPPQADEPLAPKGGAVSGADEPLAPKGGAAAASGAGAAAGAPGGAPLAAPAAAPAAAPSSANAFYPAYKPKEGQALPEAATAKEAKEAKAAEGKRQPPPPADDAMAAAQQDAAAGPPPTPTPSKPPVVKRPATFVKVALVGSSKPPLADPVAAAKVAMAALEPATSAVPSAAAPGVREARTAAQPYSKIREQYSWDVYSGGALLLELPRGWERPPTLQVRAFPCSSSLGLSAPHAPLTPPLSSSSFGLPPHPPSILILPSSPSLPRWRSSRNLTSRRPTWRACRA